MLFYLKKGHLDIADMFIMVNSQKEIDLFEMMICELNEFFLLNIFYFIKIVNK